MLDPDQSPERLDERLDGLEEALDELKDALNAQVGGEPDEESLNWEESERRPLVFWLDPIVKGTNDDAARTHFVNYVKAAWANKHIGPGQGDLLVAKRTFEIVDENGSPQDVDCLWLCFVTVADGTFQLPGNLAPLVRTDDNFSYVFFDTCHTGTVTIEDPDCDCESYPLASSSESKATGDCYSFEVLTDIGTQSGDSGEAIKLVPKKRVVKIDKCGNVAGVEAVTEDTPIPIPCCDEEDPPEMTCQDWKDRTSLNLDYEIYWTANAGNAPYDNCREVVGATQYRLLYKNQLTLNKNAGDLIFTNTLGTQTTWHNTSCVDTSLVADDSQVSIDTLGGVATIDLIGIGGIVRPCADVAGEYALEVGTDHYAKITIS
tara:strand:+ start:778 stop:1902 length:1125 start_codon:yes stop_codon:yes gene_type:complete